MVRILNAAQRRVSGHGEMSGQKNARKAGAHPPYEGLFLFLLIYLLRDLPLRLAGSLRLFMELPILHYHQQLVGVLQ